MDDTRELISIAAFARWLMAGAGAILLGGIAAGWVWGRRSGAARVGIVRGLAAGLLGPAALGLWFVYNALEDHFGLDSVAALLINLVLFLAAGALAGVLVRRAWGVTATSDAKNGEEPEGEPTLG
jgi:hypothetical protein